MPQAQGFCGSAPTRPAAQRIVVPRGPSSQGGSSSSMSPPGTPVGAANLTGCLFAPSSACGGKQPVVRSSRHQGSGSKGIAPDEMKAFLDRMKSDMMSEIRAELSDLTACMLESNRQLVANMEKLSTGVQALQDESKTRRSFQASQGSQSPTARLMASCVQSICGGDGKLGAFGRVPAQIDVAVEPEPSQMPRSEMMSPRYSEHQLRQETTAAPRASGPGAALATASGASPQAALRKQGSSSGSSVTPVIAKLQLAVSPPGGLVAGEATEVAREPFIQSLEALSQALDKLGGNMGSYLQTNITKLKNSKADNTKTAYKEWLLSELPVHAATGYKSYVDESAWMANLWISWTMEFFVEFFALLHKGKDTKSSVDGAYKKTLYNHHNFFQRTTFTAAVMQLPARDKLLKSLRGSGSEDETLKEIGEFVDLGRPIVKFCLKTNDLLDQRLQTQRKAKK